MRKTIDPARGDGSKPNPAREHQTCSDQVEFITAVLVALGISVVCGVAGFAMAALGTVGQIAGVVPLAALAGLVIWFTLGMTLRRSMIAGAVFLVDKIAIGFVL